MPAGAAPDTLPELLRIMDVATALRQEREKAAAHLAVDEVRASLRARLRATADAMGDPVTDAEIEAAIERYFARLHEYHDPPPSLQRTLAHLWIRRNAIAAVLVVLAVLGGTGWWVLFSASSPWSPAARRARLAEVRRQQEERAEQARARALERAVGVHAAVLALAREDEARQRADALLREVQAANAAGDARTVARVTGELETLRGELEEEYEIRVVNRPGEYSGVIRNYDGRLSGYYLVVEAVAPDGTILRRRVRDAEDGDKLKTVRTWGEQVPKEVYDRLEKDKRADGIVDESLFARKRRGYLAPEVVMRDARGVAPLVRGRQVANP